MRYTILIGITRAIIDNSTDAVTQARRMARALSAEATDGATAYVYQEVAPGVVRDVGCAQWRPFEAYWRGARMAMSRDKYPKL